MPYTAQSEHDRIANRVRSHLATLDSLRQTSLRLHGSIKPFVIAAANNVLSEVDALAQRHADDPVVIRWCAKVFEFVAQHKLKGESDKHEQANRKAATG